MGLPVVATDVGGTKEIIDDGKNGYLVTPEDISGLSEKIRLALTKKIMVGSKIRKTVETKFSWKQNAKEFIKLVK